MCKHSKRNFLINLTSTEITQLVLITFCNLFVLIRIFSFQLKHFPRFAHRHETHYKSYLFALSKFLSMGSFLRKLKIKINFKSLHSEKLNRHGLNPEFSLFLTFYARKVSICPQRAQGDLKY